MRRAESHIIPATYSALHMQKTAGNGYATWNGTTCHTAPAPFAGSSKCVVIKRGSDSAGYDAQTPRESVQLPTIAGRIAIESGSGDLAL